jgi:UPF0755 protein
MNNQKGGIKMFLFLSFCVAAGLLLFGYSFYRNLLFRPFDLEGERVIFEIEAGQGVLTISRRLQEEEIINSAYVFLLYSLATGSYQDLKAGQYSLSPQMTIVDINNKIRQGISLPEVVLVIPEGFDLRQSQERISDFFPEIDIASYRVADFKDSFDFLKDAPDEATLEGYLYPDTYYFSYSTSSQELVLRFLDNFKNKTADLFEKAKTENRNFHNIIIVASLLEKEVPLYEDKLIIAGVINQRLRIGMPLQVDATITYLTGRASVSISREELTINSPYNTYLYPGLPVGPIANPGLESIRAVFSPTPSDYLYWLSTPDGTTIFSGNLVEHNQAKNKYLR